MLLILQSAVEPYADDAQNVAIITDLNNKHIHLFGKVVDETGNPVPDADVLVQWEEFSAARVPMQEVWVTTDENGEWEHEAKAWRMYVQESRKNGYLFSKRQQGASVTFDEICNNRTSPTNRLSLRMHRIKNPSFLIMHSGRLARAVSQEPLFRQYDLFQNKTLTGVVSTSSTDGPHYPDLEFCVERTPGNDSWRIAYRSKSTGEGLISTNALLFEAPQSGYAPEVVIEGKKGVDFPRYLYLRTRAPALYSRLELQYSVRSESCVISCHATINPYGDRSLEPDMELESLWQLRERLTKEVIDDVTAGRRPSRDDIDERIARERERVEQE